MNLLALLVIVAAPAQQAPKWTLPKGPPSGEAGLGERIEILVREYAGPRKVRVGLLVREARSGRTVCAVDEDLPLLLASNTKLLTTAAALVRLGPDFRFRTVAGTAGGDLHVIAGGDPNLSGRFHDGDPVAVFRGWATKLREAGVSRVGNIVLHTGIFDTVTLNPGWARYEAWNWWRAPFGALSLNDNCVDVTVTGGTAGGPMKVRLSPDTGYVTIVNRSKTGPKGTPPILILSRREGTNTLTVSGRAAPGARFKTYSVTIHDPALWFGTVLRETIAREGIKVTGEIRVRADSAGDVPGLIVRASWESDLAATLKVCNRRSQNFYAEMILRTLGWKLAGHGTLANGLAAVRKFLVDEAGLEKVDQKDGSGLTRANAASASDLVTLLRFMHAHPHAKVFIDSLAVAGEPEGTLRRRMRGADVRGRVRAKTGHISGVSALSGYAASRGGKTYVFSILVNLRGGGSTVTADRLQDRICELLVRDGGE